MAEECKGTACEVRTFIKGVIKGIEENLIYIRGKLDEVALDHEGRISKMEGSTKTLKWVIIITIALGSLTLGIVGYAG